MLPAGPDNVAEVRALTGGHGVERAFDCSAHDAGPPHLHPGHPQVGQGRASWARGARSASGPREDIIHDQKSVHGSWVTTIWRMEELVERLVRWNLHPETLITHRFPLERAAEAYALMASGRCGKVAVVFDEEVR